MNGRIFLTACAVLFFGLAALLFNTSTPAEQATKIVAETLAALDSTEYEVPADKTRQWQGMQNMIQKQYDACVEDCGNNLACKDRCSQVFQSRLDRAYKQLMSQ